MTLAEKLGQLQQLSVGVSGPLADDGRNQLGSWAAEGRAEEASTVLAALLARAGDKVRVAYARGADVVVAVLGEAETMSGEAASQAVLAFEGR